MRMLETGVIVGWLVLVGSSYAALFLFPEPQSALAQAPSPPDLSPAYLPLLAALLIPGIIRRLPARPKGPDPPNH